MGYKLHRVTELRREASGKKFPAAHFIAARSAVLWSLLYWDIGNIRQGHHITFSVPGEDGNIKALFDGTNILQTS